MMKERILEFLRRENKTSAQFAEEINVQPSGISHILSGRNKPSLDFILKMLEKYPFLSVEWLLFGKGSMYKESGMEDLFAELPLNETISISGTEKSKGFSEIPSQKFSDQEKEVKGQQYSGKDSICKIVWFYENGGFEEFYPRK